MMRHQMRIAIALAATALALTLAACANSGGQACVGVNEACVQQRLNLYQQMVADPQHRWVDQSVDRQTYASGVRLFAWRASKDKMSCAQLQKGIGEMAAAKNSLSQGPLPGGSAEEHNKVKALTDDTAIELTATARKKRCA